MLQNGKRGAVSDWELFALQTLLSADVNHTVSPMQKEAFNAPQKTSFWCCLHDAQAGDAAGNKPCVLQTVLLGDAAHTMCPMCEVPIDF